MARKQNPYRRLRGIGRGVFGYNRLYLGTDHLLAVYSIYYSEDYKRFYYRDIQALVTRKTITGKIQNICLGTISLLFLLSALWFKGGWALFFNMMAGIFVMFLLINWFRGPTCISHIMTPVQTVRLFAFTRLKNTRRAMNHLKSLVEGTQGNLSQEAKSRLEMGQKEKPKTGLRGRPRPLKHEYGGFHNLLFYSLLANGIFAAIDMFVQSITLALLSSLLFLAVPVLLIMALIKQTGSDLYVSLKTMTWSTVGYICTSYILGYIIVFYVVLENPGIRSNQWEIIKKMATLSPFENPWIAGVSIFNLFCSALLGIAGLILIKKFQRAHRLTSPAPTSPPDTSFSGEIADE
ncbi:hypothetical protein ACFL9T_11680 [Thermodesulfobacteriota bacterium]